MTETCGRSSGLETHGERADGGHLGVPADERSRTHVQDCGRDHAIGCKVKNVYKGLDNSGKRDGSLTALFSRAPGSFPSAPRASGGSPSGRGWVTGRWRRWGAGGIPSVPAPRGRGQPVSREPSPHAYTHGGNSDDTRQTLIHHHRRRGGGGFRRGR